MLGTGYFLKIAKINSQQETNQFNLSKSQKLVPGKDKKKCQSAKINSRKNFVPHGRPGMGVARSRLQAPGPGTNQPRSQSSSAISDVTSPVSLSGKFA